MAHVAASGGGVPGYLGRILAGEGDPAGTCFQVAAGVLVTAWHVLQDIGAAAEGAPVLVDPLAGGSPFTVTVARLDPVHDLAILTGGTGLAAVAGDLVATVQVLPHEPVAVTGHGVVNDPGQVTRFLTAIGRWAGTAMRDDAVVLGRLTADAVMPGMSGAPVIRSRDGAVAGVVSGRFNSADGWMTGTAWAACTENLAALLAGIAEITLPEPPLAAPADLLLTVTADRVRLTGPGSDVSAGHGGVRPGLAEAVNETRRARSRASFPVRERDGAPAAPGDLSAGRAGRLLGESFLPGPVAAELARVLAAAERAHQPVRVGLAVEPSLAGLPWEALPGPADQPLALHPLVSLYRKADTVGIRMLPGPLRIVVAIAAPDHGGGPLLDYERELRNVLAAVRSARQDAADVRVVPFATTAAIRSELDRGPAHVLHITGHGTAGLLILEDHDGAARPVTADQLADEAIPPGAMPPVIALSACSTDVLSPGAGASLAGRLCQRGAAAVIATETAITDVYATRLLARVYATLASARDPDVVAALAAARRDVQAELDASPDQRDQQLAALGEWASVTVLAGSGSVPVLDPGAAGVPARRPSRSRIAGLAVREDWFFVGRRAEQRRWPADLLDPAGVAGIVACGIGGIGKTALAAELTAAILGRDPSRVPVSVAGPLTLESVLGAVVSSVRRELLVAGQGGDAVRALDVAAQAAGLGWADRLAVLRGHVLDHVPVLLVLDNFEDNLRPDGASGHVVLDEALAQLLAAWVQDPGLSRLLVTSRYPFTLPSAADRFLSFRQLGGLSRAETMKLAWSLPALDALDEGQLDRVWRLAGGHPRSLEYLDALLGGGTARYPDVTARLDAAIRRHLGGAARSQWLAARTGLDAALAETVALAADDVLLDGLLARLGQVPGAPGLLLGASVYREPADDSAVLFQVGQPDLAAEDVPDRTAAQWRITEILGAAGITLDESLDLADLPAGIREALAPHVAELFRSPSPPYLPDPDLAGQVAACQAAGLLTVTETGEEQRVFVHRWTAAELADRAAADRGGDLAAAHQQAARYWQWRVRVRWQDTAANVHDLLEARHHLLAAGDTEDAAQVTAAICAALHVLGAWDQEASLIHDTLASLPAASPQRAFVIHRLGVIAQARGDYDEATRQYQRALDISERLGDQALVASTYHQLGTVAYLRGDYDEAGRQYQRALDIFEQLDNRDGMANSYHQLGMIAQARQDYDEAGRQYQRALDIFEQLDNRDGMANSYHQLGMIAQARWDYDEAGRQFQRSLDIFEQLGDQAGMARAYHELGRLARARGDLDEAARQYQRALDISERLGDQAAMAGTYGELGTVAYMHGDLDEAARQYQRALDISERLGDQAYMAVSYHQLGILAHWRGNFDEAARQYQRALDIFERLGDQAGMAGSYSQLGSLSATRGAPTAEAVAWYARAVGIQLRLGALEAGVNIRRLAEYRREMGTEPFARLLASVADEFPGALPALRDWPGAAQTTVPPADRT